ncbi:MAG TPA: hypothetical protein DD434_10970 [Bacteroidales bacterium]|nr:hypothetical protein [Bacteroidales bacterium]
MRILFVYREFLNDNLFVHTLVKELKKRNHEVDSSVDNFWDNNKKYDIVNIQWPEEIFKYIIEKIDVVKLKNRIEDLKKQKTGILYTRHNSSPHFRNDNVLKLYHLVEQSADGIIHMGKFSINEILETEPNIKSKNFLIPHHIYENTYNENISKEDARKKLNLPLEKFIILSFGRFRDNSELFMLLNAYLSLRIKDKYLLAPRMLNFSKKKSLLKNLIYSFINIFFKVYSINSNNYDEIIDNDLLPYYLAASDVVFIQRKKILNSGNLPLGFLFKKVVLGPNCGNVNEILFETGNPIFEPNDNESIVKALENSYKLYIENHGYDNYNYAIKNMGINFVVDKYEKAYLSVIAEIKLNK